MCVSHEEQKGSVREFISFCVSIMYAFKLIEVSVYKLTQIIFVTLPTIRHTSEQQM